MDVTWPDKWVSENELKSYLKSNDDASANWGARAMALIDHQYETWPEFHTARDRFEGVRSRPLTVGTTEIVLQHNPGRRVSVAARVDPAGIQQRPCFLCVHRLFEKQRALRWNDRLNLLVNPAPIIREHLTIVSTEHRPQRLEDGLDDLPELCRTLAPEFTVCYNGPRCGASAPDHFHFQALRKGATPFESQLNGVEWLCHANPSRNWRSLRYESSVERVTTGPIGIIASPWMGRFGKVKRVDIGLWTDSVRCAAVLISDDAKAIVQAVRDVMGVLGWTIEDDREPTLNMMAWFEPRCWIVALFPRLKHRPDCYFAEGEARRLISPGAIDLAGVVVAPDLNDYERLESSELEDMFREVCWPSNDLRQRLTQLLKNV